VVVVNLTVEEAQHASPVYEDAGAARLLHRASGNVRVAHEDADAVQGRMLNHGVLDQRAVRILDLYPDPASRDGQIVDRDPAGEDLEGVRVRIRPVHRPSDVWVTLQRNVVADDRTGNRLLAIAIDCKRIRSRPRARKGR